MLGRPNSGQFFPSPNWMKAWKTEIIAICKCQISRFVAVNTKYRNSAPSATNFCPWLYYINVTKSSFLTNSALNIMLGRPNSGQFFPSPNLPCPPVYRALSLCPERPSKSGFYCIRCMIFMHLCSNHHIDDKLHLEYQFRFTSVRFDLEV
jgi:hypothetical protein